MFGRSLFNSVTKLSSGRMVWVGAEAFSHPWEPESKRTSPALHSIFFTTLPALFLISKIPSSLATT